MAWPTQGHEFVQAPGAGDGQGSLACCGPWGCKESDTTEQLNWTDFSTNDRQWVSCCGCVRLWMDNTLPNQESKFGRDPCEPVSGERQWIMRDSVQALQYSPLEGGTYHSPGRHHALDIRSQDIWQVEEDWIMLQAAWSRLYTRHRCSWHRQLLWVGFKLAELVDRYRPLWAW